MSVHPAVYQALRTLVQQSQNQIQALYQTHAQLVQVVGQIAPQALPAQHAAQQAHQGAGTQYMTPQEEQAIDYAMQGAQFDAQQQYEAAAAAAAAVSHHFAPRGGAGQRPQQRPGFVPPPPVQNLPYPAQPRPQQVQPGLDIDTMFQQLGV